jgi:dTDP-glucose 4,6-dehydratase
MSKNVLITGGAGFIGHHLVDHLIKSTDWNIDIIDKLNYASFGLKRLQDINALNNKRIRVFTFDFSVEFTDGLIKELKDTNIIFHLGAETFVEHSIKNPLPFIYSNVLGTARMLELAKSFKKIEYFLYFSTDEVFGVAKEGEHFKEWDRFNSRNPYSASKASGEEIALAYSIAYSIPVFVLHSMNIVGERQYPEKYLPKLIRKLLNEEIIYVHSDETLKIPGSRYYLYCEDLIDAIFTIIDNIGRNIEGENINWKRDIFNITGSKEINNLELAQFVAKIMGKKLKYEFIDYHTMHPGHDLRYSLDGHRMKKLGWTPPKDIFEKISKTVKWTTEHKEWLRQV